jgi:hypothetical protein
MDVVVAYAVCCGSDCEMAYEPRVILEIDGKRML